MGAAAAGYWLGRHSQPENDAHDHDNPDEAFEDLEDVDDQGFEEEMADALFEEDDTGFQDDQNDEGGGMATD